MVAGLGCLPQAKFETEFAGACHVQQQFFAEYGIPGDAVRSVSDSDFAR